MAESFFEWSFTSKGSNFTKKHAMEFILEILFLRAAAAEAHLEGSWLLLLLLFFFIIIISIIIICFTSIYSIFFTRDHFQGTKIIKIAIVSPNGNFSLTHLT